MKKIKLLFTALLVHFLSISHAQDSTQTERNMQRALSAVPGRTKMTISGVVWGGFQTNLNSTDKLMPRTTFNDFGFSPMFLIKFSDKFFVESELEIKNAGDAENAAAFDLEYAKMSWIPNKYITIGMGKMLSPFGAYGEKWEPNHVDRFANAPLRPDDAFLPDDTHLFWGSVLGFDARGHIPMRNSKLTWAVYIDNGPTLHTEPEMGGVTQAENYNDMNNNKEVGGRFGFLPFASSSLEIGLSGKYAKVGGLEDSVYVINGEYKDYKNVASTAYAVDFSYVKPISSIKSIIGLRGQFTSVTVDKAYYAVPAGFTPAAANYAPGDSTLYTFDNTMNSYFVQLSFRPAMLENAILKNFEVLVRYNSLTPPKDAAWGIKDKNGNGGTITRLDIGLDYWLTWRIGLRMAYETTAMPDGTKTDMFIARLAAGF
ncbi:MAG TPA: hypothetical protein VFJ43_15290 [Bacteroidia bacterium]|nr:hypothetical protein [Bacteroidia bacterium]